MKILNCLILAVKSHAILAIKGSAVSVVHAIKHVTMYIRMHDCLIK